MAECLTEQHLLLFGRIVHAFACYETLMQEAMAAISGADAADVKLMTKGLDFAQKHAALFSLMRHRSLPLDQADEIRRRLDLPHTLLPLRDDVAHSTWNPGKPENQIAPSWLSKGPKTAVQPVHDIGDQAKPFHEDYPDTATYTVKNLAEAADSLEANCEVLAAYLAANDLLPTYTAGER